MIKWKEEYHSIQNSKDKNLDEDTRKFVLDGIYIKAYNAIRKKYPDLTEEQIKDKTDNDWLNSPNDYYTINDATDRLNEFMDSYVNSDYWRDMRYQSQENLLIRFSIEVGGNKPLDLKNNPDWQNSLFIYNGELVDRDALANIAYGYFGSFLGLADIILKIGAAGAQSVDDAKNGNFHFPKDDPRDAARVKQGIELYKSRLSKGIIVENYKQGEADTYFFNKMYDNFFKDNYYKPSYKP